MIQRSWFSKFGVAACPADKCLRVLVTSLSGPVRKQTSQSKVNPQVPNSTCSMRAAFLSDLQSLAKRPAVAGRCQGDEDAEPKKSSKQKAGGCSALPCTEGLSFKASIFCFACNRCRLCAMPMQQAIPMVEFMAEDCTIDNKVPTVSESM